MDRQLDDWIESYIEHVYHTESPKNYHTWSSLFCVSSALQRKCWVMNGSIKIFPNLFVVLVGPSGARKTQAIAYGRDILEQTQRVVIGSNCPTREALIRAMAENLQTSPLPSGQHMNHCSLSVMSTEFGVFLGQNNTKLLADLTDFYDCAEDWKYDTKTSGKDHIYGVYLSILGAITPDGISTHVPQDAIGGGFTSRLVVVMEHGRNKRIAEPVVDIRLRQLLVHDLNQISNLAGAFALTPEARAWFNYWYENEDEKSWLSDDRIQHYFERRHHTLLKLGMLISAARSDSMQITKEHLFYGLSLLRVIEPNMAEAYSGVGRSSTAAVIGLVMTTLQVSKDKKMTGQQLLARTYRQLDQGWDTLEKVLSTLIRAGKIEQLMEDDKVYYRATDNLDVK